MKGMGSSRQFGVRDGASSVAGDVMNTQWFEKEGTSELSELQG